MRVAGDPGGGLADVTAAWRSVNADPPTQPVAGEGGWLETASGEIGKPSERSVRSAAALRLQVLCSHAAVSAPVVFSTNPSPPHLPSVTPYPSQPPPPPFVVKTLHSSRCHRLHEIPCKCRAFCCCRCSTVLRTCLRRTLLEPRPPPPPPAGPSCQAPVQ